MQEERIRDGKMVRRICQILSLLKIVLKVSFRLRNQNVRGINSIARETRKRV